MTTRTEFDGAIVALPASREPVPDQVFELLPGVAIGAYAERFEPVPGLSVLYVIQRLGADGDGVAYNIETPGGASRVLVVEREGRSPIATVSTVSAPVDARRVAPG
jgi:hypothetical protein